MGGGGWEGGNGGGGCEGESGEGNASQRTGGSASQGTGAGHHRASIHLVRINATVCSCAMQSDTCTAQRRVNSVRRRVHGTGTKQSIRSQQSCRRSCPTLATLQRTGRPRLGPHNHDLPYTRPVLTKWHALLEACHGIRGRNTLHIAHRQKADDPRDADCACVCVCVCVRAHACVCVCVCVCVCPRGINSCIPRMRELSLVEAATLFRVAAFGVLRTGFAGGFDGFSRNEQGDEWTNGTKWGNNNDQRHLETQRTHVRQTD